MYQLAGERFQLARNDVVYELCRVQNRHTRLVGADWEHYIAGAIVPALAETFGTAGVERARTELQLGGETPEQLKAEVTALFLPGADMPTWLSTEVLADAVDRVRAILEDSGPSAEDAAAWAPVLVHRAGTYVLACALAETFDRAYAASATRSD